MASAAEMLEVRNPRTGEADHRIPVSSREEVAAKAAALRENQRAWEAMGVEGRCGVMARWLGAVKARAADIGEADAVDTGGCHTSYIQGFITMGNIGGWLEDAPKAFADLAWKGMSTSMPTVEVESQVVAYPITGVISPWNAPLMLALLDAIPALFAGSAVLLKPSEVTPRVIEALFETVREVPELAKVFDYVTGPSQVGQAVIEEVDTICFTGSVPTGRKVAVACAERLIPCNLELGGKDPCIVTENADLERAATAVLRGAVYATGQVCYSIERVYVHESVHDQFVALLAEKAGEVRFNAENPKAGHIGPFTFAPQAAIVTAHIADAVAQGATVVTGGEVENIGGGLYLRPTILTGVNHDMLIMQDETFGPCIPVMAYSDTEEAIRLANDTHFGLTASVIAGDAEEAKAIGRRINAGGIFLQDTFLTFAKLRTFGSDSFGWSGYGSPRIGPESLRRFLRRKSLLTQTGAVADIRNDHHLDEEA
ncbi:aldehyde dehydrogenase family protein [Alteraurantiacibacter aquimixticola]|uniref:Aldehyde dehydrogenase family protein n=1 Tax=Alteraurantiacibacter aquimixticola TaxID=2489173 RepID=A0A4T3EYB5_9SPHN|nr:aldehyde dehydrogenase family protein [Alteraurantiacibacter aquimixticola]TIX49596.1 aldehyde dehydrogenase family protein [Alteraurantiacibacter aquimixticola]